MRSLGDRVIIITGGARGLGAATAEAICARGGISVITDVLSEEGEATAAALRKKGYRAEFALLDVRSADEWLALVDGVIERHGRIDGLVNNAGICIIGTIEELDADDVRRNYDVNVIGTFNGMKTVFPKMKSQGKGAIVNIASNSTHRAFSNGVAYGSSKAAVASISRSVAMTGAKQGIRVNTVHPGPHATEMVLGAGGAGESSELKALIDAIPMGRMGQPGDVGSVVGFLLSDEAGYITAAEIFVDGGVTPAG